VKLRYTDFDKLVHPTVAEFHVPPAESKLAS
jgi:hypothetical protein